MKTKRLFDHPVRCCSWCNCPLPDNIEGEYCPNCQEEALFREVKDYVRNNDVNEFQVSEEFHIPLSKVKRWIREGRLEYKDEDLAIKLHCERCGKPIQFGLLCKDCIRAIHGIKGGFQANKQGNAGEIRFNNKDYL